MAIGPDALEPGQRELLRRLARGAGVDEVADALGLDVADVDVAGREALVALDPALAALVAPQDRRLLAGYVLRLHADDAAVAAVLAGSADARRWSVWLGEALSFIVPDAPPVRMPGSGSGRSADDGSAERDPAPPAQPPKTLPRGADAGTRRSVPEPAADAPLTRGDRAILALTVVAGLILLGLGIALS